MNVQSKPTPKWTGSLDQTHAPNASKPAPSHRCRKQQRDHPTDANAESARAIYQERGSAPVTLIVVPGADHFSVIAPATEVAAQAILADTGATSALAITEAAIRARL